MIPWFWLWAPQFHLPLSGGVKQDIAPDTHWFFGSIRPEAGNGQVEQEIFNVASYGKQLGLILDVLLPLVNEEALASEEARQSFRKLKEIYARIENVKAHSKEQMEINAVTLLKKIEATDPEMLQRVMRAFDK